MYLSLAIHNHQPVGNMGFILDEAYRKAYGPFLDVLGQFPDVKAGIHISGYLFRWLLDEKPDYIARLKAMVDRRQVEIISAGMYEPVLAMIPEADARAQLIIHQNLMEETFGTRPTGAWLTERVYEPHIPGVLAKAGIAYTIVDDNHFRMAGFEEDQLYGYYRTEFEGESIAVYPGLERLRYTIPFSPVDEIDRYLREAAGKGAEIVVFGDDGEKFGLWPGTFHSVYEERWLIRFFQYLSDNQDWLQTITPGRFIMEKPAKGLAYLDCSSYKEMGEWCLPARFTSRFTPARTYLDETWGLAYRGGYYRNFLVKYPESNDMHKKMLRLSRSAGDSRDARDHLYRAQCNDAYWHGVFGGLYLPHLRSSVYGNLIEGERAVQPKGAYVQVVKDDINVDGFDEIILENDRLQATFLLKEGGALYELDCKPKAVNVMATLTRRFEGYHDKVARAGTAESVDGSKTIHDLVLSKEENLEQYLDYDWHRRASFIDHVLGQDARFDALHRATYVEPADFVREPYRAKASESNDSRGTVVLLREGHIFQGGQSSPLTITKSFALDKGAQSLSAAYGVTGSLPGPFSLGVEFNFSFLGSGGDRYMEFDGTRHALDVKGWLPGASLIRCVDPYQEIEVVLAVDGCSGIVTFPVEVVSLSEEGFERNYQSTMIMPVWSLEQGPSSLSFTVTLTVTPL